MATPEQIRNGYSAITDAPSTGDAQRAYAEYHQFLTAEQPEVDVIEASASQDPRSLRAVEIARGATIKDRYRGDSIVPLLRGSGIIVVGNSRGDILAANYQDNGSDPVAEQYGNYQWVALNKIAHGAILGRLATKEDTRREVVQRPYNVVQRILEELGFVRKGDPPHHMGYEFSFPTSYSHDFISVGASGMMPSDEVLEKLRANLKSELQRDRDWVDWPGDEFAGMIDAHVAKMVTRVYANPNATIIPDNIDDLSILTSYAMARGENVH